MTENIISPGLSKIPIPSTQYLIPNNQFRSTINEQRTTNNETMTSLKPWLTIAEDSDFSIYNLPFGIFSQGDNEPRVGIAIGDYILDLCRLYELGKLEIAGVTREVLESNYLNDFISLGKGKTRLVRMRAQELLSEGNDEIRQYEDVLIPMGSAVMHLPVKVGDYTDFYSSIEHATNVGMMFRDPANALLPNWKHIPVGYHGRASSIIVSGQPVHRPKGQQKPPDSDTPVFGPSKRLDIELEMGFIVGRNTEIGDSIPVTEAEEYIFGMVLFNDWSARDIQKWEYVPLGPFLGKSFASSVSPWVVTMEALDYFRVPGPVQDPPVLPYLKLDGDRNFDVNLEVGLTPENGAETIICRSNFKYMYWNMSQQLAHHTVNGCNVCVGDLMASGTISGKDKNSYGSMLELSWGGKNPIELEGGNTRTFLEDYDTVTLRGFAEKDGIRVGFGEVRSQILPAK